MPEHMPPHHEILEHFSCTSRARSTPLPHLTGPLVEPLLHLCCRLALGFIATALLKSEALNILMCMLKVSDAAKPVFLHGDRFGFCHDVVWRFC